MGDGLGEALDGPLAGAVDGDEGHAALRADAGDLLDQAARGNLAVAHGLHGGARHVQHAEEIHLHLPPDLRVAELLEAAGQPVAGVVDHDVHAPELGERRVERGQDRGFRRHVQRQREVVFRRRVREAQSARVPRRRHHVLALVQRFLRVVFPEPRRRARDEEDSRHGGVVVVVFDMSVFIFDFA